MIIESVNNPKVKNWVKLKEKKYRDATDTFIVEGDHLVKEALKYGKVKEIIALDQEFLDESCPFYQVSLAVMKKISCQMSISKVAAVVQKFDCLEIKGNVCLLDNLQDPGNLGTIIRSAVAFGIQTIILGLDTVDLYNDKVIRASEGMVFNLNFRRQDLKEAILELKQKGYKIYGTDVLKGISLNEVSFSGKNGIIIGNEGLGMKEVLKKECDYLLNIPINSNCESLNAGVAASIIFYVISKS